MTTLTTLTPVRLTAAAPQQLGNTVRLLYTCPANTYAKVSATTLSNTSAVPVSATLHLVPAGSSPSVQTQIISNQNIAGNSTYIGSELNNHILHPGDQLWGLSSVPNALNVTISGSHFS